MSLVSTRSISLDITFNSSNPPPPLPSVSSTGDAQKDRAERQFADGRGGGGGRGSKSFDSEKAWSSITHSIFSKTPSLHDYAGRFASNQKSTVKKTGWFAKRQTFECFAPVQFTDQAIFALLSVYHLMRHLCLYYFPSVDFWRQSRCGVFAATVSSLTVTPAIKLIFTRIWLNTTAGTVRHPLLLIYWLYTTINTVLNKRQYFLVF